MAIDVALNAFLNLRDDEVAAFALTRAAELDLTLPEPTLQAIGENLSLLRLQAAVFVTALAEAGDDAPETFTP
ncbi:hypothetical protein [Caulobacter henricii]|uniref:DUF4089 domain-containing protein n=1 Tax=Caulobacter henricii TaxID=69395 RepID=A0A0P0NX79_9CAUL|nr:hypothetical protein [Caulobacter henricii]ALL12665.1 hypothetical protein AQ619_04465 [Caulobacter henricii]